MKKRQGLLAILLSLVLVLLVAAGCAPQAIEPPPPPPLAQEPPPTPTPTPAPPPAVEPGVTGQFIGGAMGFQGPIEVQITVEDGIITEIEYLEFQDTLSLTHVAKERIPAQIIAHQSLGVDTVVGVTMTSFGIIGAVMQASIEAGLDVVALRQPPNISPGLDVAIDTDILVIGGGGAGFAAAISAANEGANVVLIEKASVVGGNTMMAGAAINAVNPYTQAGMTLSVAQYNTLRSIAALEAADPALKFQHFPEWAPILAELQAEINAFFAYYSDRVPGPAGEGTMPGFDSHNLHLWQMYIHGVREMLDGSFIASDLDLARTIVENAHEILQWLYHTAGVPTNYSPERQETLSTVLGAMWPRTHGMAGGVARMAYFTGTALGLGIDLMLDTRGTELIVDNTGRVVGAKAICMIYGTNLTFNTTMGVVLATGGFGDNAPMAVYYDNFWGDNLLPTTLSTNSGTLVGDGIQMARNIGAALTADMGVLQMMPSSSPTKGTMTDGIWGSAEAQLWIDRYGNRFVNEYAGRDELAFASMALEGGIFYIIWAGPAVAVDDMPIPRVHRGIDPEVDARINAFVPREYIWFGGTLRELYEHSQSVRAKGVDNSWTYESLRATIERYNQIVIDQHDPDFGKEVIGGFIDLDYIESNPNVGISISPRRSSIHHTMGGVQIDVYARVINVNGDPIPGLWAAGEVAGGIHAGNRLGGNALPDIFVFGRIAGQSAVLDR